MDGVPIQEAAQRLGISVEAVRKRARRGSLSAYKTDGLWYIALPDDQAAMPETGRDATRATGRDDHDAARTRQAGTGDTITLDFVLSLRDELKALHGQLATKDQQLSEKDRQIEQLHILLQTSQQNEQRLLSATVPAPPGSPERRQDTTVPVSTEKTPQRGAGDAPAPAAVWRGWLRRWFGGN